MDSSGRTDSLETNEVGAENTTSSNQESAEAGESTADSPRKEKGSKVFCDPVHGHISLHPLLAKIVDTPQFQRLRHIRQLGSTYFVYPGASHNRFEHCIGTAHLAGKLARIIREQQPELGIDKYDILCVEMAGLCHDLGHGPFSHLFDGVLKRLRPDDDPEWTHEQSSCDMFDHLIKANGLRKEIVKEIGEIGITFVKKMILPGEEVSDTAVWSEKKLGRPESKSFLFEIISNERNKVDVDKWDYFARDCHHLGIRNSFDHNRFMEFIKVDKLDGQRLQICARDKECENLYEMFHTRSFLHRRAYQHKVAKVIDCMIGDAMVLANPYVTILGENGARKKISQCVDDSVAYTKLNDGILDLIVYLAETEPTEQDIKDHLETERAKSTEEGLEMQDDWKKQETSKWKNARKTDLGNARKLLDDVFHRTFYEQIGVIKSKTVGKRIQSHITVCGETTSIVVEKDLVGDIRKELEKAEETTLLEIIGDVENLTHEDLALSVRKVDYGMGSENPVDKFLFYKKPDPKKPNSEKPFYMKNTDVSAMLPGVFQEVEVLIFCKENERVKTAKRCFKEWGEKKFQDEQESNAKKY